ncbi:hypothetical protein MLD38_025920 [Melastoma candidum]|uniref:Uncharacterized protein n=1 Tax=Melastoma candidum TaxID=119954 RepID=A0ACB9NZS1_9MYRT|nr:hypothetical protein MLD38_025920 [Melastoma candidum]
MSTSANTPQNSFFHSLLEKERLRSDGTNFLDWSRQMGIVLRYERKEYVLDVPLPEQPTGDITSDDIAKYRKHLDDEHEVQTLLLSMMESELQKEFLYQNSYFIMNKLKKMFQEKARIERYKVIQDLLSCKMSEGSSVSTHLLKMFGLLRELERLNHPVEQSLATDIVLNSLPKSFSGFIMNYHMNDMDKSLEELHGMLKTADADMKKGSSSVLVVSSGSERTKKGNYKVGVILNQHLKWLRKMFKYPLKSSRLKFKKIQYHK